MRHCDRFVETGWPVLATLSHKGFIGETRGVELDGHFEGPAPWSLDLHTMVWGDEHEAYSLKQLDGVGTLLFGRWTFEGMAAYWSNEDTRRLDGELKSFTTNQSAQLWGPSPVVPAPIRPGG